MVKVTIGGGGELQCPEANFVESFVINAESLIGVFDELVDGESSVIGFDDGIRDFG
jgi:hypothetical protein